MGQPVRLGTSTNSGVVSLWRRPGRRFGTHDLLDRMRPGHHVCLAFDDEPTRIAGAVAYVRAGLHEHHKVLYYGDGPDRILTELEAHGVRSGEALASGQLQLSTPQATYLASGAFQAEPTIEGWRNEAARAAREGYAALRAVGDMSWASRSLPGVEELPRYEAQVNGSLPTATRWRCVSTTVDYSPRPVCSVSSGRIRPPSAWTPIRPRPVAPDRTNPRADRCPAAG